MVSARDVDQSELVKALAAELEMIKQPDWSLFVKTGVSRDRPPQQKNWWQLRAASVLKHVYMDGPVGTSRLKSYYGGLHRRGHKPAHFAKAGGKIIRTILKDLETAKLIEPSGKQGRKITKEGQKLVDGAARKIGKK